MEFELSFSPISHDENDYQAAQLGNQVMAYTQGNFPNLSEADLVIFCVPEYRGNSIENSSENFEKIRLELYELFEGPERLRIADLGNLVLGEKITDTYQLLADVLTECEHRNLFSLVIGGTQDLTIAQYNSCKQLGKLSNIVSVDSRLDLGLVKNAKSSNSYLSEIINSKPNVLFNFSNIGYQSYLNPQTSVKLINDLYFDAFRLGEIRRDLEEVEPILRNADLVSIDMNSVRLSDSPANDDGSPNGFYSEEICQIMRYAGISGRIKSLGIYHYDSNNDDSSKTAKLISQMIWCFFDGFFHKMKTFKPTDKDMAKYHVSMRDGEYNACFFKNKKMNKWWMEIPLLNNNAKSIDEGYFIPCSYSDYKQAVKGDVPERWWKAFQKMN
ncbi:MAG: formimidoylglutamase [Flavobacteriales bacterium]|nr:formimidoylglutamase [Flavobacteriales bacterium]